MLDIYFQNILIPYVSVFSIVTHRAISFSRKRHAYDKSSWTQNYNKVQSFCNYVVAVFFNNITAILFDDLTAILFDQDGHVV